MNRGRFVSFEGGEGAGKSTVISRVREAVEGAGFEVVQTREPGGTVAGEAMRAILLDRTHATLDDASELLLMFASRAQLVREVIEPALSRGAWVLSDRFTDSSFAYQGGGRGMDSAFIMHLESHVVRIRPDLTLLLDLNVRVGHARIAARADAADRIEVQGEDFFERVRAAYLGRAKSEPTRFRVLDASRAAEQVAADAVASVAGLLADALASNGGPGT